MLTNPNAQDQPVDDNGFVDELKPGTKLLRGQYTIDRFLNAGGFGITYLARDSLDRKVVIKECFPGAFCRRSRYVVQARSRAHQNEFKSIVRLFVQEARSLAKLDHPNIVGVHQVFEDNETAYMALDYVEGRDLSQLIEDPDVVLAPAQVVQILRDVLGAVAFIHEQGMLHRDISPDNILLTQDHRPVLIDFGAAREQVSKQSRALSALRVVKDGYSPQEFYIAGSDQNASSDLYALAASFHHLITDDLPPNAQARLAAIASGDADPYVKIADRIPGYEPAFLVALDKALSVLPKDRIQSAGEWLAMLDGTLSPAGRSELPNAAGQDGPSAGKNRARLPLVIGAAAGVALLGWAGLMLTRPVPPEPASAPQIAAAVTPAPMPALPDLPVTTAMTLPSLTGGRPVQDSAAPTRDLPSTPAAIRGPDIAIAAVVPGNPVPDQQMQIGLSLQLPFDPAGLRSNIIARRADDAPDWVVPGLIVTDVNGIALSAITDVSAALVDQITDNATIIASFGLRDPASGARLEETASLPVVQTLTLISGYQFETRFTGETWATRVTAIPADAAGDLQVGDVLVTYIPTAQSLDRRDSLAVLLHDEAVQTVDNLIFAVERENSMWVASLAQDETAKPLQEK